VLWIALLVVLTWALIRWVNNRTTSPTQPANTLAGSGPTPMEILSQRYARGEIDATTFEQMRERLEASDHALHRNQPGVR